MSEGIFGPLLCEIITALTINQGRRHERGQQGAAESEGRRSRNEEKEWSSFTHKDDGVTIQCIKLYKTKKVQLSKANGQSEN